MAGGETLLRCTCFTNLDFPSVNIWISAFISHQTESEELSDCGYELALSWRWCGGPFGPVPHGIDEKWRGDVCKGERWMSRWRRVGPGGAAWHPFFSSAGVSGREQVKPRGCWGPGSCWWGTGPSVDWGGCRRTAMSLCPPLDTLHLSGEPSQTRPKNPVYWRQMPCSPVTTETRRNT